MTDPIDDPERRMHRERYKAARQARLAKKRAGKAASVAHLKVGYYTIPCLMCDIPGPGKDFKTSSGDTLRICRKCWKQMPPKQKKEIHDSF